MKWMPLPDGTWTAFSKSRRKNSGGSLEQYKHPCLVPDLEFGSKLFVEMAAIGSAAAADTSTLGDDRTSCRSRSHPRARASGRLTKHTRLSRVRNSAGTRRIRWGSGDFPAFLTHALRRATALPTAIP